jgi:hypothetical protein
MLMGFGIAIDVALATVSKFHDRELSWKNWTLPIMATHIAFPAIGYYLFWGLGKEFAAISSLLGIIGFLFVLAFVYEVVCEAVGKEPIFGISEWMSKRMGLQENDTRRFIAILAVSWDALWSGPAKAAQAVAGSWGTKEVIFSFPVAGLTVALIAQISLGAAWLLRQKKFKSVERMAEWFVWGKYVELSVIGGFGILSLWQALTGEGNIYLSVVVAGIILLVVWATFSQKIVNSSFEEAQEAIGEVPKKYQHCPECGEDAIVPCGSYSKCMSCGYAPAIP